MSNSNIETSNMTLASMDNSAEHFPARHFRYWVNGDTGSDSNNGLTQSTPFKTLAPVFAMFNQGMLDVRTYIDAPGTYDVVGVNLNSATLHISASSNVNGNIVLRFVTPSGMTSDGTFAFYNCHLNIVGSANSQIQFTGNKIYMDAGNALLKYCAWQYSLINYGGAIVAEYCDFSNVRLDNGSLRLNAPTFRACTDNGVESFIHGQHGRMYVSGKITIIDNTINSSISFFKAHGSIFVVASALPALSNRLKSFIIQNDNSVRISTGRYNSLSGACVAIDGGSYNQFIKS